MAYLGYDGIVKFKRTSPEPIVVPGSSVNKTSNWIETDYDDWLLAEELYVIHSTGQISGAVHRDELDRIYLHTTIDGALSNGLATRISFNAIDTTKPVCILAGSSVSQRSLISSFVGGLNQILSEKRLSSWPATWNSYKTAATENPTQVQGEIRRWDFSRSSQEVDVGSIGEKFATFVKATVSGSGSIDFIVNLYSSQSTIDTDLLMRLVQLTDHGSTASAKFYLRKAGQECKMGDKSPISSSLFFQSDIIITGSAIGASVDDIVSGSANFVTTGPIRLLSE